MPEPRKRSRTLRRVYKRTPSGKSTLTYAKRKPARAQCAGCGTFLYSVPQVRANQLKNMAKTKKRPERAYGGYYCPACSKRALIAKSRKE